MLGGCEGLRSPCVGHNARVGPNRPEACNMADEQTPQSDLIDDAIRQAERQLEEKLEALRMSALGDSAAPATAPAMDEAEAAVLRPTSAGPSRTSSGAD